MLVPKSALGQVLEESENEVEKVTLPSSAGKSATGPFSDSTRVHSFHGCFSFFHMFPFEIYCWVHGLLQQRQGTGTAKKLAERQHTLRAWKAYGVNNVRLRSQSADRQ